jgi:hypothetical protein
MDLKPYNEKEYNRLCVEFIGLKCHEPSGYWTLPTFMDGDGWTMTDMKFHSDWNWIIEVVEKIKKVIGNPTTVTVACFNGDINKALMSAKKEAVVQSIWEFLNWYNEQKQ